MGHNPIRLIFLSGFAVLPPEINHHRYNDPEWPDLDDKEYEINKLEPAFRQGLLESFGEFGPLFGVVFEVLLFRQCQVEGAVINLVA